ncbi:MAG: phosphonate metabolism transcriptional regulator PhnF [Roseomonas sp.]|nr:phosphonate metabolism transcriptional regulator PhnF [Roseomonas sp.]MCA3380155.1 phosphonate metabolism transcriptional regulator PhnF [Roseomonas sp.]
MVETLMTNPALARGSGVALWRQIALALEADISAGKRQPGERLPTEAMLTERFAVNRHTVRRALEELEAHGIIRVEQGRGAFVAEDVLDYPLGPRTRFSEIIRRQNREAAGRILQIAEIPAEAQVAAGLRIRRGKMVLRVARLCLANGRPVALGLHHFPLPRFAAAAQSLAEQASITAALAACGVPDYRRHSTRITARLPSPEEAKHLMQSRSRPVIVAEALNTDPEGTPVDWTLVSYAAARVQLVMES